MTGITLGGGPFGWRIGDDPCIGIQRRSGTRPCPAATSLPAAARCPASRPGPPGRSPPGTWTATASPRSARPQHDRKAEAAEFVLVEPKPVSLSGPMQGQVGWQACYRSFNGI
jgi:hypothetical protein